MNIQNNTKFKKIAIVAAMLLLASAIVAGVALWQRGKNSISLQTETKCSDYPGGLPVWPDNLIAFTGDAYGVVIGEIVNPDAYNLSWEVGDTPPRLQITDVLKGIALHEGDTIPLCGNTGSIEFTNDNHTVVAFLDGKNQGTWIPLQGYIGIIPQGKDGKFKQEWGDGSKTWATVDELKKQIK